MLFFYSDQNYHLKRSFSDQKKSLISHMHNGFPHVCRSHTSNPKPLPSLPGPSASMPRLRKRSPRHYIKKTRPKAKVFLCVVHIFLASLTRQRTRNRTNFTFHQTLPGCFGANHSKMAGKMWKYNTKDMVCKGK